MSTPAASNATWTWQDSGIWSSAHLFLPWSVFSPEYESVLLHELVQPLSELQRNRTVGGAFFVRYGEGGPHIRLRVQVRPDHESTYRAWLQDRMDMARLEGALPPASRLEWSPYVPEVERYGGPEAVALAERFFCSSSALMPALLVGVAEMQRSARYGRALAMTLIMALLATGTTTAARSLLTSYTRRLVGSRVTQGRHHAVATQFADAFVAQRAPLSALVTRIVETTLSEAWEDSVLRQYDASTRDYITALRAMHVAGRVTRRGGSSSWDGDVRDILTSQLHMTNNRLGISPLEEAYLADVSTHALSERMGAVVG